VDLADAEAMRILEAVGMLICRYLRGGWNHTMKILIADDSSFMRRLVRKSIEQAAIANLEIVEVDNGEAALEAIGRVKPDFVVADWNMPGKTGIEVLHALRAEQNNVPFGFVTSEGTDDVRKQASDAGALFFVCKPFTADELAATIKEHVGAVA